MVKRRLDIHDHSRDSEGLRYVYTVLSRRAGGVSVGINLNPNSACNWRCAYCQVPNLVRGHAPEIDVSRLREELELTLTRLGDPESLAIMAPEGMRRIHDIAISGNGEPSSCQQFDAVAQAIVDLRAQHDGLSDVASVLITNGSFVHRDEVLRGLEILGARGAQVWFKLDAVTPGYRLRINDTRQPIERLRLNMGLAADRARLRLQRCVVRMDGEYPPANEESAYRRFVAELIEAGVALEDLTLYSLARPSLQPEADRLLPAEPGWLEDRAAAMSEELGVSVSAVIT